MKALIVEDDYVSGKLLEKILTEHGKCNIIDNGIDALKEYEKSIESGRSTYDLICLDIMMPNMTGHEVLKKIRLMEEEKEIKNTVKIIMTTALGDFDNIKQSYREQCEDYLIKPIIKTKVEESLRKLGLLT